MIYVMSDIHGNSERFNSVMKQIDLKPTDTLYVLGDVIDRFPDGIKILRRLMAMPNVKMLLGNHEYMMLNCLDLDEDKYTQACRDRMFRLWHSNGGDITHYYMKHNRISVRKEIFKYLRSLPIEYDVTVNGTHYKLVHGAPVDIFKQHLKEYSSPLHFAVWKRLDIDTELPDDYTLIFGHTPTHRYQEADPLSVWYGKNRIGIDCGSGFPPPGYFSFYHGRLACIRLDDMKVFYSE